MIKFKDIWCSFLNLIYPPLCFHCTSDLSNQNKHLCCDCFNLLQLIDVNERCPRCFNQKEMFETDCFNCRKTAPIFKGMAACFDYEGPVVTLLQKIKRADFSYLTEGVGSYMAAQFLKLDWPMPDFIIPVPLTFMDKLERGVDPNNLLAQQVSKILNIPVLQPLKKVSRGDLEIFVLKKQEDVENKRILILNDFLFTGKALKLCSEALLDASPQEIYGLTVCCHISYT